jgi:zinc transporter ZupT
MVNFWPIFKINKFFYAMIFSGINDIGPLYLTLVVTLFIWFIIILGAATVFLTKDVHPKFNISSLGFAAGAMLFVAIRHIFHKILKSQYRNWGQYLHYSALR